jgi:hypothetical protein
LYFDNKLFTFDNKTRFSRLPTLKYIEFPAEYYFYQVDLLPIYKTKIKKPYQGCFLQNLSETHDIPPKNFPSDWQPIKKRPDFHPVSLIKTYTLKRK